jgi:hypothetical protein
MIRGKVRQNIGLGVNEFEHFIKGIFLYSKEVIF